MEHGVNKLKAVLAGLVASLMVCAMAAPAMAQATATAGNVNFQYQFCPQVIQQYAAGVNSNSGGGIAAAIAQDLGISQDAVNACIQGEVPAPVTAPDDGDNGGDPGTTDDDDNGDDPGTTGEDRDVDENGVLTATIPDKVLAATGGEVAAAPSLVSASSILMSGGALLVISGMMAFWFGNRRG
ncbi:MAG: hypothetical protein ACRDSJ_25025 [Rubrobacteraceae bacterium]